MYWLLWWRSFFLALFISVVLKWNADPRHVGVTVAYLLIFPLVCYSALRKRYWFHDLVFVERETNKTISTPKQHHVNSLKIVLAMILPAYGFALIGVPVALLADFWIDNKAFTWVAYRDEIIDGVAIVMIMGAPFIAPITAFQWKFADFRLETRKKRRQ